MFTKRTWVQLSLVLAALVIFGPRSLAQTISCSSDDGHRHYCPANTRGRVRLAQQRSESSCREGYSWGSDERGIWVDHGCRGDFVIEEGEGRDRDRDRDQDRDRDGDRAGDHDRDRDRDRNANRDDDSRGSDQVISCASDDMHRHYCPADTRGGVQLLKQRSDSPCEQGRSWGYDRRGIWVDHGCRGDFQVIR